VQISNLSQKFSYEGEKKLLGKNKQTNKKKQLCNFFQLGRNGFSISPTVLTDVDLYLNQEKN